MSKEENRTSFGIEPSFPYAPAQNEKRTYTVDEIQNILGISKSTAYALVKNNEFKSINVGRHIRISKKSFDEWLDSQT
ncbi:MAG: helix-turn-helix domain-containing protein [Christensenellales bacterium]|jgi:excisionase family DNA binding protein